MYQYKAIVKSLYDADTFTLLIDVGFKITIERKVRLARIDAREMRGPNKKQGKEARDWCRDIMIGKQVTITTKKDHKKGKYGRYIAEIEHAGININDTLVEMGFAVYKEY